MYSGVDSPKLGAYYHLPGWVLHCAAHTACVMCGPELRDPVGGHAGHGAARLRPREGLGAVGTFSFSLWGFCFLGDDDLEKSVRLALDAE